MIPTYVRRQHPKIYSGALTSSEDHQGPDRIGSPPQDRSRDGNPGSRQVYANIPDREILEKAYDRAVSEEMLPAKQVPTLDGINTILAGLVKEEPQAKLSKPEQFVDMRFVNELDKSGFIESLYRR